MLCAQLSDANELLRRRNGVLRWIADNGAEGLLEAVPNCCPTVPISKRRNENPPVDAIINVLRRDGHRCQYCGSAERLTLDHVLPRSRGGKDAWENLVAACTPCNNKKSNRTPEEAGMPLARRPFRPSHVMYMRDLVGTLDETWKPYLYAA